MQFIRPAKPPKAYARSATASAAYTDGWQRGYDIAVDVMNDPPKLGATIWFEGEGKVVVTAAGLRDILDTMAMERETYDRAYSPFEQRASRYNRARNSETLWRAFDDGISDGVGAALAGFEPPPVPHCLTHGSNYGMKLSDSTFESLADARRAAAKRIRSLRKLGFGVVVIEPGREWEVLEPDDAMMVPRECGIIRIAPDA